MKQKNNPGMYESIQHLMNSAAKIFVTGVRSSAYHWHYDYEFIAVLKGRIEVQYGLYGPEPQRLSEGDIILINPKGVHGVRGIELDNICLLIQFPSSLFEPITAGMKYHFFLNSANGQYPPKLPYGHYLNIAVRTALAQRNDGADTNLRVNAGLYLLLADFLASVQYELRSAPLNNEKDTELVMAISGYIDRNLSSENLSDDIYRTFGLSEKGSYRLLKEIVGLTLKEMIDAARIERACTLLQDAGIPLQIVSDECGYSGEATFYRRFKAAMGITPGEYRKGAEANAVSNDIQDYLSFDECGVDALLCYWAGLEE